MEHLNGFLPSWMVAICISKLHFSGKKVLGTFGFFDDFWQLLVNLRGLKHAPDLNKMLMDYSNNTKVIQWHKNLWKSDKTNNKFMEKLGKRTKHTFGNWQINWLSNHVSKILTQSVVDKYIRFLGFFISVFFFNTEYRFKGCFLYPYNKAACLSVCVSDASPCPHFWADFKSTYIYGLPMVQGRFKNYFQGNRSRNKKIF